MPTAHLAGSPLLLCLTAALTVSLTAALMAGRPAAAQTPGIGFTPTAFAVEDNASDVTSSPTGSFSLGFEFKANSPTLVTALGFFNDPSFNTAAPFNTVALVPPPTGTYTFATTHLVGLYQVVGGVGTLLGSATVTAAGTKIGDFLYQSLTTPLLLVTGGDYVLAGVTGPTDPYIYDVQDLNQPGNVGLTTSPSITYVQDRYASSSTLTFPGSTDAGSEPGFFGPNFLSAPIPEASTSLSLGLLLAFGLGGVLAARRRKARASA